MVVITNSQNNLRTSNAQAKLDQNEVNVELYKIACRRYGVEVNEKIRSALKKGLKEVSIGMDYIGDNGAKALADVLKVNHLITRLYLSDNQIGKEGAKALAEALKVNKKITDFELNFNAIGNEGGKAFAEALKINPRITTIDLTDDWIGMGGIKAIAEVLKENNNIRSLDLSLNTRPDKESIEENDIIFFGDEVAKVIAEALKVNKGLMFLSLENEMIGNEGAKALADAFKINKNARYISLYGNRIREEGKKALSEAKAVRDASGKPIEIYLEK